MNRPFAACLMTAAGLLALSACKPPAGGLPPPPPKMGVLAAIPGEFTAGPPCFVIGAQETTDADRLRGAVTDLFAGDPGHICFRGGPLEAMSLVERAFSRTVGKQESHFEHGRVMVRLANPLDPKAPHTTFELWPCAELSIGGTRTHDLARVRGAIVDQWAGDPGKLCFHGTEMEARALVETAFREHKHFDRAEARPGEITVWLRNPLDAKDTKPRAFPYKRCAN